VKLLPIEQNITAQSIFKYIQQKLDRLLGWCRASPDINAARHYGSKYNLSLIIKKSIENNDNFRSDVISSQRKCGNENHPSKKIKKN
jgi:hypothetical protein